MGLRKSIRAVLFDFGGVVAEEGFLEGLRAIGGKNGLDPDRFFAAVESLIYETGYLVGNAPEDVFWDAVRKSTGISEDDGALRREILSRFMVRPAVLSQVDGLRSRGLIVAMLSDQTNWLDEIDRQTALFRHFDRVFNSYHIHRSKRDASVFPYVCGALGVKIQETLFIDDNLKHIERAGRMGLLTLHFVSVDDFARQLTTFVSPFEGEESA